MADRKIFPSTEENAPLQTAAGRGTARCFVSSMPCFHLLLYRKQRFMSNFKRENLYNRCRPGRLPAGDRNAQCGLVSGLAVYVYTKTDR